MGFNFKHLFLLPSAVLASLVSDSGLLQLEPREEENQIIPAPIFISPDQVSIFASLM